MTKDNRSQVRRVLLITLLLNLLVMGLKGVVGIVTGSLSLQADALHSVTDSANNILGLVASHFSSPTPDRRHPYGHQKYEGVAALGIAAFLGIACFEIIQGAIEKIWHGGDPINISAEQLWILLIVLGINIFVAFYERKIGKEVDSPILIADAYHTMSDIWVTIMVLLGLIGIWQGQQFNLPQLQWLDVIFAFPVAILVFYSGWEVVKSNLPWLVDEMAIAPEKIYEIVMNVPGVINCHDIASRGMVGQQVFLEMHLIVEAQDVKRSHKITEEIERILKEKFAPIRIIIHVEPPNYESSNISFSSDNGNKNKSNF